MAVVAVVGAVVSAVAAIRQGQAQQASANYQAQVARNNATLAANNQAVQQQNADIAGGQAKDALAAGAANEKSNIFEGRGLVGRQFTTQAANGLDVNDGSAVQVREGQSTINQMSQANIRSDAARTAYGFRIQEANYKSAATAAGNQETMFEGESTAQTILGENAVSGSYLSAAGNLASGLGSAYKTWNTPSSGTKVSMR